MAARVHHVKKARKAYKQEGIKKGEPYFWWKFRFAKHPIRRKTEPRPSQLTQSDFWSTLLSASEGFSDELQAAAAFSDIESARDTFKGELETLRDSQQEKLDNMPEPLQQGDTGQLLQERYDGLEELINELDAVDIPDDDDDKDISEALGGLVGELEACSYGGS